MLNRTTLARLRVSSGISETPRKICPFPKASPPGVRETRRRCLRSPGCFSRMWMKPLADTLIDSSIPLRRRNPWHGKQIVSVQHTCDT
jgi:hypothetical protein